MIDYLGFGVDLRDPTGLRYQEVCTLDLVVSVCVIALFDLP